MYTKFNKTVYGTLEPDPDPTNQLSRNFFRLDVFGGVFEIYRSTCNYLCFGLRTPGSKWHCVSFPLGRCKDQDCEVHNAQ